MNDTVPVVRGDPELWRRLEWAMFRAMLDSNEKNKAEFERAQIAWLKSVEEKEPK